MAEHQSAEGLAKEHRNSTNVLPRNFDWEKGQRCRFAWLRVLLFPFRVITGLVVFLLFCVGWVLWLCLYPFCWVFCGRKASIPTADKAYPEGYYHPLGTPNDPILNSGKPYRIAIIGGGWTGLGAGHELLLKGVEVSIFEAQSKLGGTWNPDYSYHGLHIHGPMWITEGREAYEERRRNECISAGDVYQYLVDFSNKHGLGKVLQLNSRVQRVRYNSKTGKSEIEVNQNGELRTFGDYDAVIYTGFVSSPSSPTWPKQNEFQGRVLHVAELSTPVFTQIVDQQSKVVIVGGGKASVDILTYFGQAGHKNLTWLSRSTYLFFHYTAICHDNTLYGQVRGVFLLMALTASLISETLCSIMLHIINCVVSPRGFTLDLKKCHMGVLTKEHIKHSSQAPLIKSEIANFTPTGVKLKNGKTLECDYVVCCTGYTTGTANIIYEVDGRRVQWEQVESLYEGIVSPIMPRMVFSHCAPYDLGMKRSTVLADHVMSYLIRNPDPSHVKNTMFGSRSCNMTQGLNMDKSKPLIKVLLFNWLMLIYTGVISFSNLLSHVIGMFLCSRVRVLQVNHPKSKRK